MKRRKVGRAHTARPADGLESKQRGPLEGPPSVSPPRSPLAHDLVLASARRIHVGRSQLAFFVRQANVAHGHGYDIRFLSCHPA
jgi:hypothetical protein